jgi:hypothetical protein
VKTVLLETSGTHSRKGNLFFATLYDYTESPRKSKKFDESHGYMLRVVRENGYPSSGVGGNGFSEILLKVELGGVKW